MTEYYKTLGITTEATLEEVKTAYRKLSKKFHPDVNQGDKYFEERFKEIQYAYNMIINEKREKQTQFNTEATSNRNEEYYNSNENTQSKNNYSKIIVTIFIIIIVAIMKPLIQKSIRENAENDLIKTYENKNTFDDNSQMQNTNYQTTKSKITTESNSSLKYTKNDALDENEVLEEENRATLTESKQWILSKLNKYVNEHIVYSEPGLLTFPIKSRYYNYNFTFSENNLIVTYSEEFSEIVLDEETKNNYRNTNHSEDMIKRLAGKMTVTAIKSFKIVVPVKNIEYIYFDKDKDYKGNCDLSISTKKNDMIKFNLTSNDKSYFSYFSFNFDCSQEENLGVRINDAFFYLKKIIPQTNINSNEPF